MIPEVVCIHIKYTYMQTYTQDWQPSELRLVIKLERLRKLTS